MMKFFKKKTHALISSMAFLTFFFTVPCFGQVKVYKNGALQYHTISDHRSGGRVEKIDFLDTVTNKILNSVSVIELNPYYALSQKCKAVKDSNTIFTRYIYPKNHTEGKDVWDGKSISDKPAYFVMDRAGGGSGFPTTYLAFGYYKKIYNASDSLLAIVRSHYIFNTRGEMVQAFENIVSRNRPMFTMVSKNGQYMCVSSISTDGSDVYFLDFYDIASKKHLDRIEMPFVNHEVLPNPVLDNKFLVALTFDGDSVWYQVYDVENKTMQEERFHPDDYVRWDREGIKIVYPDKTTAYKYYKDFQIKKTEKK
jgi:hypothetical protein